MSADQPAETEEMPLAAAVAALPAHLERLADKARTYARAATSANTDRAYKSDWRHFTGWARRQGLPALPPDPQTVGLYIAACASGLATHNGKLGSVRTIERRLSALTSIYAQQGAPLDRSDRHVATVLAGIRRTHGKPPVQKDPILPGDLRSMLETLPLGTLRGLRDRAILLLGFAGGLRRSEIVGLDVGQDQTEDGSGWVEILPKGAVLTFRGKTGWREVEIGRGSTDLTCPVTALETWLELARIAHGPLFRRVKGEGKEVGIERLNDRHVARLIKAAICKRALEPRSFPGIRCVPVWRLPLKLTSAMFRSS